MSWTRDDDEFIVDDPVIIKLAAWATGVYDKEYWYSGDIPFEVWGAVENDMVDQIVEHIDAGATWSQALTATATKDQS